MAWTAPSTCRRTRSGRGAQTANSTDSGMRQPPGGTGWGGAILPARGPLNRAGSAASCDLQQQRLGIFRCLVAGPHHELIGPHEHEAGAVVGRLSGAVADDAQRDAEVLGRRLEAV